MFGTLKRIAAALEHRNQIADLHMRAAGATNQILLELLKRSDPTEAREKSASALESATAQLMAHLEKLAEQPVRITTDGAETPQLARPRQRGLIVGSGTDTAGQPV
ncbi:MAG: hypothetical protein GY778_28875 [bacterium]|nr:hypothetical protein [bacterium]